MKGMELAIAIDRQMLARTVDEPLNPYVCTVPTGLTGQEILDLVYGKAVEEFLEEDPDQGSFPHHYDYLWHGSVASDGSVNGSECTEEYGTIQPPNCTFLKKPNARRPDE